MRIATDLLDVPAEIIALIYQHRWSIELFFGFFKQLLGCRYPFFWLPSCKIPGRFDRLCGEADFFPSFKA